MQRVTKSQSALIAIRNVSNEMEGVDAGEDRDILSHDRE